MKAGGPRLIFSVIDSNILAGIGLKELIMRIMPMARVDLFNSFEEFAAIETVRYIHLFVSSRLFFEHAGFFREYGRCLVLVNGETHIDGVFTLNIRQSEDSFMEALRSAMQQGHHRHDSKKMEPQAGMILTPRESQVAALLCKGLINKEIADVLSISLTTVISHRKNIMTKLKARSLADIIVYSVTNGLVSVDDLLPMQDSAVSAK